VQKSLDNLIALLDLEELEVNIFRGRCTEGWQRVFGGQVLAQALVAAGRTVDEGAAHSFHAYFLRPRDSTIPILYNVDRTRDGLRQDQQTRLRDERTRTGGQDTQPFGAIDFFGVIDFLGSSVFGGRRSLGAIGFGGSSFTVDQRF